MATATAMYHSARNPLRKVTYKTEKVGTVKDPQQRRLHKAFLRYHDPNNWPLLREALMKMGRADLIGPGKHQLIPKTQPETHGYKSARRKNSTPPGGRKSGKPMLTQHTGLPPRDDGSQRPKPQSQARPKAKARPSHKASTAGSGSRPRRGSKR